MCTGTHLVMVVVVVVMMMMIKMVVVVVVVIMMMMVMIMIITMMIHDDEQYKFIFLFKHPTLFPRSVLHLTIFRLLLPALCVSPQDATQPSITIAA
jgi:hypothetical protein